MLLLLPAAFAMSDPWDCSAPASLVAMRAVSFADPEIVFETAWEAAYAWVDDDCVAACEEPYVYACEEAACTTAAGAEIEYRSYDEWSPDGVSEQRLVVRLPEGAGETWTELTLERIDSRSGDHFSSSSSEAWTVSWVGTLSPDWPADERVSVSSTSYWGTAGGSTYDRSGLEFAGAACAWSYATDRGEGDTCDPSWGSHLRRTMNDLTATVDWVPCDSCLGGQYRGVFAGAPVGTVDPLTWLPSGTIDADGDGFYGDDDDCDDADPSAHPCADDVPYDGLDLDCEGDDDFDADGDGYTSAAYGGDDCDDTRWSIHPGARDAECDGVDSDCDGADPCTEDTGGADTGSADTATSDTGTSDTADTETADTETADSDAAEDTASSARPREPRRDDGCGGGAGALLLLGALPLLARRKPRS